MSFSGNYLTTSFKQELLEAKHDFSAGTFKLALYDNNASFTEATTVYTATDEVTGTGYSAGGAALTNVAPVTSGTTAYADFDDLTFSTVTLTARGALIYNTANNEAVAILDFGVDKVRTAADLVITFPSPDALNAIVRVQ